MVGTDGIKRVVNGFQNEDYSACSAVSALIVVVVGYSMIRPIQIRDSLLHMTQPVDTVTPDIDRLINDRSNEHAAPEWGWRQPARRAAADLRRRCFRRPRSNGLLTLINPEFVGATGAARRRRLPERARLQRR